MNETMVTVVGNVATAPVYRESAQGPLARFRMAATPRRWDRQRQSWSDGPTSFYTVWTARQLASNVAASVAVGEPVIVQGRLRVRESERGGQQWTTAEIDAASVGHDLTRGTAAFRRVRKPTGTWPGTTGPQDTRSASAAQRAAESGLAADKDTGEAEPDWSTSGVGAGGEWGAETPAGQEDGAAPGPEAEPTPPAATGTRPARTTTARSRPKATPGTRTASGAGEQGAQGAQGQEDAG